MLKESLVATTALSSFNNAALYAPFFAMVGLLTLPLLWIVYLYARDFEIKFGWNNHNRDNQISFWSSLFLVVWLLLCGGNYAVIRDGISLLPVLIAGVMFILMAIVTQKSIQLNYMARLKSVWVRLIILFALFLMVAAYGYENILGMLLQFSAILSGIIVGVFMRKNISLIPSSVAVFLTTIVLILMQPEFFRFGQLGNLTVVHLLSIVITGFCAVTALTARYVRACNRIHQSAYIKLKWLFRIFSLLALVLFILTESVPVFMGLLCAICSSEILSIYHSKNTFENISKQSLAYFLICVGIVMICPAVSGLGALYLSALPDRAKIADVLALL